MLDTLSLKMCDPFNVMDFKVLQPSPEMDGWWEVSVSDSHTGDIIGSLTVRNGEYVSIDVMIGESEHDLSDALGWWVADYWRNRSTTKEQTENGFRTAPARYTQQDRETTDRIRDRLGDEGFEAFCVGTAMRYEDRRGAKGDPDGDNEKERWFRMMAAHVAGEGPDPREKRPGFRPYVRMPYVRMPYVRMPYVRMPYVRMSYVRMGGSDESR